MGYQFFENEEKLQHCCAIATRSLVHKKEHPGDFTIPYTNGILHCEKPFYDFGANISLMLLSIYKKFDFGAPKPTMMHLLMVEYKCEEAYLVLLGVRLLIRAEGK